METESISFLNLVLIGVFIGALYSFFAKNRGISIGKTFFYALSGSLLGGTLSYLMISGGELIMAVVFSVVVLFLGHIMARRAQAERERQKRLSSD